MNLAFDFDGFHSFDLINLKKLDRIHPYPAKFTIDLTLDYIEKYSKDFDLVLDMFCGSGTSLLGAKILHRQPIGFDINFIAILITQFKMLDLNAKDLSYLNDFSPKFISTPLYHYESVNHWFKQDAIKALSSLKEQIKFYASENEKYLIFLNLIFSSIINIVSNQDSDTRYASIEKPHINIEFVFDKFKEKLYNAIEIYADLLPLPNIKSSVFLHNSKQLSQKLDKESVSLILTSPPYPNTYDYYLYHKHRMCWLDFNFKFSMQNEIGSRREFSSLKLPKEKFNNDLLEIFTQADIVLKNAGFVVLVMGDGKIAGQIYNAKDELLPLCEKMQWKLIDYSYSELDKTSRSFMQSYRTKNKKEHIMVFQKVR